MNFITVRDRHKNRASFCRSSDRVHDERNVIPFGVESPIHVPARSLKMVKRPSCPDSPPFVNALKNMKTSVRRLKISNGCGKKNARILRIALQDGIVAVGLRFRRSCRLRHSVPWPRRSSEDAPAGSRVDALPGNAREKFPHAGEVVRSNAACRCRFSPEFAAAFARSVTAEAARANSATSTLPTVKRRPRCFSAPRFQSL